MLFLKCKHFQETLTVNQKIKPELVRADHCASATIHDHVIQAIRRIHGQFLTANITKHSKYKDVMKENVCLGGGGGF